MHTCRGKSATDCRKWFRKMVAKLRPFFGRENATVWVYALSKTNFRSTVFWSQNRCWKTEPQSRMWANRGTPLAGEPRLRSEAACSPSGAPFGMTRRVFECPDGWCRVRALFTKILQHTLMERAGGRVPTHLLTGSWKRAASVHSRSESKPNCLLN